MRITDNMRFVSVQRSLGSLRSRQAEVINQVSTGKRVNAPSDDPVAAARLTRLNAQASRIADYQNTIGTVRSDTSLAERSLDQASQLMAHAHELAVQGANGAMTADDRKMLATELSTMQEQFLAIANTRGTRGYLFSGSQTSTAALSSTGQYQGDDAEQQVEISPGVTTRVSVTGAHAFTAADGGTDAYAALEELRQGLLTNDTSRITGSLEVVEKSRSQIVRVQGESGLILNRLDSADEALAVSSVETEKSRSDLGDVDPFAALSELTQLSTSLDQAIAVARQTFSSGNGFFGG
jgi:flagellar hook-associated protein 3 FlgL